MLQRDVLIRGIRRELEHSPVQIPLARQQQSQLQQPLQRPVAEKLTVTSSPSPSPSLSLLFLLAAEPEFVLPKEYEEIQLLTQMTLGLKLKSADWTSLRISKADDPEILAAIENRKPKGVVQFGGPKMSVSQKKGFSYLMAPDLGELVKDPKKKKDFWVKLKSLVYD